MNHFIENITNIDVLMYNLKTLFLCILTYYTMQKLIATKSNGKLKSFIAIILIIIVVAIDYYIKYKTNNIIGLFTLIFMLGIVFSIINKINIGYSILITIVGLSFNYIIFSIAITITYIINTFLKINNQFLKFIIIEIIYCVILYKISSLNKIKYGILFLKKITQGLSLDLVILNISCCILFSIVMITNMEFWFSRSFLVLFIIFSIMMFITIQKSLQLYYKQKMLIKDLTETKEELENKKKEIEELEAENIRISKKNHTIVHKQKSIEHKLEEMLIKSEISIEEAGEVKERLEKLHTQIYSEKENTELDKTGITNIDDMLNYMQSECTKNKIEFTLVIKGNIHYMVNNLIPKEDLETLIADHIKDAIIAINHTDNINRSILVKLGNIDGIYSLYIYDSGVEFKKEVLENLGIKPFTTYESEGGTGMGFMNTFDTLRKCKASLIIEEFNEPKTDNYTKLIAIKFDNNNKFEIKSYRKIEIKKKI